MRCTQMGFDCGVDTKELKKINDYFVPVKDKFSANGTVRPLRAVHQDRCAHLPDPGRHAVQPGGAAQGTERNRSSLDEVLEETPRVRADMGYPPLVTPLSQMVGVQATVNVLLGGRYKSIGKEIKSYIHGEYGKRTGRR